MIDFLPRIMIEDAVKLTIQEDLGLGGDATSRAVINADTMGEARINSRQAGIVAGLDVARTAFLLLDPDLKLTLHKQDGDPIENGDTLMTISGSMQSILSAERVALNYLGRLSGIASLTGNMVAAAAPYVPRIACTRKTTPNLRLFEKYAVRCGGGSQHRLALDDCLMIKDNHIAANKGDIHATLERARAYAGHTTKIEIEVDTLEQLTEVLDIGIADIILLDNMKPETLSKAVEMTGKRAILEASGGITLSTIQDIAASGVDVISIGALTHSAPCLDIGLDMDLA